jgi:hypothetical protein
VTTVNLSQGSENFLSGDGTYVPLERRTSGVFAGTYVAKNRNILSDYFTNPNTEDVWQYAMDGTSYKYVKSSATLPIYKLNAIISRAGIRSDIFVGEGLPIEYMQFGNERVSITRSGKNVSLVNTRKPDRWVILVRDLNNRLVRIRYADNTAYDLVYEGTTTRLLSSKLTTATDSEETKFIYDNLGRLVNKIFSNGTSVRYSRNLTTRIVRGEYPNGQIQDEKFDANGNLVSTKTYIVGSPDKPLQEANFSYDPTGRLLSTTFPSGLSTIKIDQLYAPTLASLPAGYKKYENGTLIEELNETWAVYEWVNKRSVLRNGSGSVLADIQYVYSNERPFLLRAVNFLEGSGKGSKEEYLYSGINTTVSYFNEKGTKTETKVYAADLVTQAINHLAPTSLQLTEYAYDIEKRPISIKQAGKEQVYTYDAKDRTTYAKGTDGLEHFSYYNADDYIEKEEIKHPGGAMETITYSRDFHDTAKKKIKTLLVSEVYPKETIGNRTEYNEDGGVVRVFKNGVLAWEG